MQYRIQNQDIELELANDVFSPSPHGSSALGGAIKINKGETVLDIGTGTGLLAILASKLGGKTTAIDVLPQAVELANKNILKNNVSINVLLGDLFEPVQGNTYDVVIGNIPQENLSPNVIKSLSKETVIGMHGGEDGNELLLRVIRSAHTVMHKDSRLYVVVYSMSNFRLSIEEIVKRYDATLINFYTGPVKDFVYSDIDWYKERSEDGMLNIYKQGEKYYADLYVFELRLKG